MESCAQGYATGCYCYLIVGSTYPCVLEQDAEPKIALDGQVSTLRERENKEKLVEQRGVAAANLPQRTHLVVSGELVGEMGDGLAHFIHILPLMVVPFQ